ncbi:MAG: hypothetical protein WAN66_14210 [Limnoraphis robusta]|nr:hypothetical protein [Limnoraphis robusta]
MNIVQKNRRRKKRGLKRLNLEGAMGAKTLSSPEFSGFSRQAKYKRSS